MLAVTFAEYGGPEVLRLEKREVPTPAHDQVVVKVVASTVNPTDILMRTGEQPDLIVDLAPP